MGTNWTTTPEFAHEDESEEFVVLMFAVPHPPQRERVQYEVGREGPVGRQLLDRRARDRLGPRLCVSSAR